MRGQSTRLTQRLRRTYDPVLQEYYGSNCFFCIDAINDNTEGFELEYHHLDGKEYHNNIENIVRSHSVCHKKCHSGDSLFNDLANRQIERNSKNTILQDMLEKRKKTNLELEEKNVEKDNEEIVSNMEFIKITQNYLDTKIHARNPRLPYVTTLNDITYLCFKKTQHGDQNTIRRKLAMLTSISAKYEIVRDGGMRYIQRRINLT